MKRSRASTSLRNDSSTTIKDDLPQDFNLRKEAIENRIKVSEDINSKILKCKKSMQEKKARNQQKIDQIRCQGNVDTNSIENEIISLEEQKQRIEDQIQQKRNVLTDKKKEIQHEIDAKQWEMELDNQKMELEIQGLERHPKLKSQSEIEELKRELEKMILAPIPRPVSNFKNQRDNDHNCPVCSNKPKECHGCVTCDNWVCQGCMAQIEHCPHCREDLTQKPLKRYKAVERIIIRGEEI